MARGKEDCCRVLADNDSLSLDSRAERLVTIPVAVFPPDSAMPERASRLLLEACQCYVNGQFNGCIATLGMAVEHGLRMLLEQNKDLYGLVKAAKEEGKLDEDSAQVLHRLRLFRNGTVHSDIDGLVKGLTLQTQKVWLTESGIRTLSDWEELEPNDPFDKEVAVALAAECRVKEHLLRSAEDYGSAFWWNPGSLAPDRRCREQPSMLLHYGRLDLNNTALQDSVRGLSCSCSVVFLDFLICSSLGPSLIPRASSRSSRS